MGKLHFESRSLHWPLEGLAQSSLERWGGSQGTGHPPSRSLRRGRTEHLPLFLLTVLPPGDESPRGKGVSGACLLCLVNGIPYMALVFLTGDMFLDRKLISSQFFR